MVMRIESNSRELMARYQRRQAKLVSMAATRPTVFATSLSTIRKRNIEKLVYRKSPYMSETGSRKPTFRLLEGERTMGGTVFNDVDYAGNRMTMTGGYAKEPGLTKDANWGEVSILEFIPVMRLQQSQMNRSIWQA